MFDVYSAAHDAVLRRLLRDERAKMRGSRPLCFSLIIAPREADTLQRREFVYLQSALKMRCFFHAVEAAAMICLRVDYAPFRGVAPDMLVSLYGDAPRASPLRVLFAAASVCAYGATARAPYVSAQYCRAMSARDAIFRRAMPRGYFFSSD